MTTNIVSGNLLVPLHEEMMPDGLQTALIRNTGLLVPVLALPFAESSRLEGISEGDLVQPPSQPCQDVQGFILMPLSSPVSMLDHCLVKCFSLSCFFHVSTWVHWLLSCHCAPMRNVWFQHLYTFLLGSCRQQWHFPFTFLLETEQIQFCQNPISH